VSLVDRVDALTVTAKDHRPLPSTIAHGVFAGLMMILTFAMGVFAGGFLVVLAQYVTVQPR
jgi:hypothetical protein